ncbi:bifunctional 2-methylcitrate dehydratase/aconitate hydratase [Microbulbifer sp. TYP-18]|uniref:bifunctional 2-methylcitrate dehydratase/aconitate hydratase n=1 Tax=Microbulbifer sp. TYP-18 TaxID=3230024 RepID=UPI0034C6749B
MDSNADQNVRPAFDRVIQAIADYVVACQIDSDEAFATARLCLMDSIGCGLLALNFPECAKLLGPVVEGTVVPGGARVPGTRFRLDPVKAAWDIGCTVRWLDFNDTWLAAEWGHPSDNLGAILSLCDYLAQKQVAGGDQPLTMRDLLDAMIRAYEIQGVLALENSFNRVGLDHVLLVRVASAAVSARLMGGDRDQVMAAVSQAWADGGALRAYRHAPNTGSRKSWAAGDASARGVQLADITMRGEMGIPAVLSTGAWGFYDVLFSKTNADQKIKPVPERQFVFPQGASPDFGSYVMENILFKISFPAEFHGQTACEAAVRLHPQVRDRVRDIDRVVITTQESALRIISKEGPLSNAADRDHCLQYMTAVSLLFGDLTAEHYEDSFHQAHPELDRLREKFQVVEDKEYSKAYLDPRKRSIANAVQVFFSDGSATEKVEIEYPLGHRRRRKEAIPLLHTKFRRNLASRLPRDRCENILSLWTEPQRFDQLSVNEFMDRLVI